LAGHSNVAVSATYVLPNTFTRPLKEYAYRACETVITKNPILSAIPVKDSHDTWFFRLPGIDLTQSVSFQRRGHDYPTEDQPDIELCNLLQVQQKSEFTAPLPFWRLIILTEPTERRFTAIKLWPYRDPGLWTGPKSYTPVDIEIRQIVISETISTTLRKKCRQNHATITSALHTAVARSLLAHLPEEYTRLQAIGAMSTRRWLKEEGGVTDQSMGVWVMDFKESFFREEMDQHPPDSFLWGVARKSCTTIKEVLSRKGKDSSVGLLRYLDGHGFIRGKIGKDRDGSFKASNLGVLEAGQERVSWPQIGRMMFAQPFDGVSAPLAVSSITGGDGCLVVTITWQKGLADSTMFDGVVDMIARELRH
ncbi:hypothetical protein ASPNIDRAFT_134632, partial [Aspergillus niger ATCC 1015]